MVQVICNKVFLWVFLAYENQLKWILKYLPHENTVSWNFYPTSSPETSEYVRYKQIFKKGQKFSETVVLGH